MELRGTLTWNDDKLVVAIDGVSIEQALPGIKNLGGDLRQLFADFDVDRPVVLQKKVAQVSSIPGSSAVKSRVLRYMKASYSSGPNGTVDWTVAG